MNTYECNTCGFLYDEAEGLPDEGFHPEPDGKTFRDDWVCPECGATKADFTPIVFD
jgi:rubredoxin